MREDNDLISVLYLINNDTQQALSGYKAHILKHCIISDREMCSMLILCYSYCF